MRKVEMTRWVADKSPQEKSESSNMNDVYAHAKTKQNTIIYRKTDRQKDIITTDSLETQKKNA